MATRFVGACTDLLCTAALCAFCCAACQPRTVRTVVVDRRDVRADASLSDLNDETGGLVRPNALPDLSKLEFVDAMDRD